MNESAMQGVSQVNETVENDVTISYSKTSNFMANDPKGNIFGYFIGLVVEIIVILIIELKKIWTKL